MRVLIFAPYAKVWPHVVLESQLERMLKKLGHEVLMVNCFESFISFCHMHESSGLKIDSNIVERKRVCESCIKNSITGRGPANPAAMINDYRQEGDEREIQEFIKKVANLKLDELLFHDLYVGKMALAEVVLRYKKRDIQLTSDEFEHFKKILENVLTVILLGERLLLADKPDVVLGLNAGYAVPSAFYKLSMALGFRTLYLAGGPSIDDLSKSIVSWDFRKFGYTNPGKDLWIHTDYAPTSIEKRKIKRYFKKLRASKLAWTYSSAPNKISSKEFFNIPSDSKIFLLAMNSFDEVTALGLLDEEFKTNFQSKVFVNQIEWVKYTIDYFRANPALTLIIRPHPREMPNKREDQLAESAYEWKKFLSNKPDNVIIDHPELRFSIFDHFRSIDALITGWSSTAIEAMHEGIPVITYDSSLTGFPSTLTYTGTSRAEYISNIDLVARTCPRIDPSQSESWLSFHHYAGSIHLGGGLTDRPLFSQILKGSLMHRVILRLFPSMLRKLDIFMPVSHKNDVALDKLVRGVTETLYGN